MEDLRIYDDSGAPYDLATLGLLGLKLDVPPPDFETESVQLEGVPGEQIIDRRLLPRTLQASLWLQAPGYAESLLARDRIYAILGGGQIFYVGEPDVMGKRWKVRLGDWSMQRINPRTQSIDIPFVVPSGSAESTQLSYQRFSMVAFRYHNIGDLLINMRYHDETEIRFTGASTNLAIRNLTTGDEWRYNGTTVAGDEIVLKGVRSTKNGASIFGRTNHQLLTIAPGWNEFEVIGAADGFTLSIHTRFYFL